MGGLIEIFKTFSLDQLKKEPFFRSIIAVLLLQTLEGWSRWGTTLFLQSVDSPFSLCWPHFSQCQVSISAETLTLLSKLILPTVIGLVIVGFYFLLVSQYKKLFVLLTGLLVLRIYAVFFSSYLISTPFGWFHLSILLVVLFSPSKLTSMRWVLAFLYLFSGLHKLYPGWINGSIFSSTQTGLPLVPEHLTPLFSQMVLLLEILTPALLVSPLKKLRIVAGLLLLSFHGYSITIVGLVFSYYTVPFLFILLAEDIKYKVNLKTKTSWSTSFVLGIITALNFGFAAAPGEPIFIQNGFRYVMGMMDGNHQCRSETKIMHPNQTPSASVRNWNSGSFHCDIYSVMNYEKALCKKNTNTQVYWNFDHSVNGSPFYRIISDKNICELEYSLWSNAWVNTQLDNTHIAGFPRKNVRYKNTNTLSIVSETPQLESTATQKWIDRHILFFEMLYQFLWAASFCYLSYRFLYLRLRLPTIL